MRLKKVKIKYFRNIIDSSQINIEDNVTCLVGKNESGKTAVLEAIHMLNPVNPSVGFRIHDQYPAWLAKLDKQKGKNLENEIPVSGIFSLGDDEISAIESDFGKNVIVRPNKITAERNYEGVLIIKVEVSEKSFVQFLIEEVDWPYGTKTDAKKADTVQKLQIYCDTLRSSQEKPEFITIADAIDEKIKITLKEKSLVEVIQDRIIEFLPKFLYFSKYNTLPYTVDIKKIIGTPKKDLSPSEQTAKAFLRLAAADSEYLDNSDYERRIRELENVANAVTDDVLKYWTQNPELRVRPDITQQTETKPDGKHAVVHELKIRIWDDRHSLSLPFSEHSTGFQWFFSFLVAFSEFEFKEDNLILLLDEPALGLHAKAQSDFLRFIDERLTTNNQVVYTTHSPFMVQTGSLERIRLVEDKGKEVGATVTSDVTTTDPDTIFPLQGALGYDLVQNLFIAPHNLVVEGTSDFTYLQSISDYLESSDRIHLDPHWSIVPVGGADMIPTFIALLGNHLDVTVIIDGNKGGHQKITNLLKAKIIQEKRIITIGEILERNSGDIEDLFDPKDYLHIFNQSMGTSFNVSDFIGDQPIVRALAEKLGRERFNHGIPADYFLRNRSVILPELSDTSLNNFEKLIALVNETLAMHSEES